MKKRVEILSPAGSYECLRAAIAAGADAVYVGGTRFGARAYANNFTEDELYRLWIGDLFEDYSPTQVGEEEYDEPHRWNIPVSQVIKIEDRYFMIYCFQGLTECQESYYDTQPDEVYPVEKTITVICWEGVPPHVLEEEKN